MIYPLQEQYIKDAEKYNIIPIFQSFRADLETPLSIFLKIKGQFLLESIERGENVGRYSIMALGKKVSLELTGKTLHIKEYENNCLTREENIEFANPLLKVREYFKQFRVPVYPDLPPFSGGAIGYLGYETVQYFENIPVHSGNGIPDGLLIIPETLLVYDTVKRTVAIVVCSTPGQAPQKSYQDAQARINELAALLAKPLSYREPAVNETAEPEITSNVKKEYFLDSVKKAKDYIKEGEIIQVVLSQEFQIKTGATPFELYRTLRIMNPSPYLFYLDFGDFCIVGSSPEVMVRVQKREILLKPIAGTRHRGKSVAEDQVIARELLGDPKEKAEHIMLVDLGRNDLGRVAVPGSVEVCDYQTVEKYSHVMHIVSTIKAELDPQFDVFDVIRATFPAGTLSGAPKVRAMEIISELEKSKRGPYGGMIFNLGFNGDMDSCITIRTIILKDGVARIQAGAGIVADSIPENEFQETVNKAKALVETVKITQSRRDL